MNKELRKWLIGWIAALMMMAAVIPVGGITAFAATARIAFSDPSVTVGQEFNVNVKITTQDGTLGASDVVLSYDPSVIEFVGGNNASGGAGSIRLVGTMDSGNTTQFSHTLKFKALQAGNCSISVGSYEVYDADTQMVNVTKVGSSAVKVNAPATYSKEAALASLKVSPGQLSPAFSPDVTSYTVNVGGDVDKLAVSAGAKDGKARVLVSGDSGLKIGANTVVCKVTAEDGQTTKTYTITVNKSESAEIPEDTAAGVETGAAVLGDQTAEVDGTAYTVAASFDPAALPEGYTQSTTSYGGTDIMCGTGNGLTLIYLQAADGTGSFFVYVPESGELSPYVTIDVAAKSILVLPPDASVEIPEGFAATSIQLNGNYKVQGWVWKSDEQQQYCVVYGMNENGEKNLYRYDIAEKTFQRYFKDPALQSKYDDAKVDNLIDQYNSLCEDYNFRFIIIVALIVVCLILFFIVINLLLHRRETSREERSDYRQSQGNTGRTSSAGQRSSGQRSQGQRAISQEKRMTTDHSGAQERRAAYERAVAAERRAAEQAMVSGRRTVPERGEHSERSYRPMRSEYDSTLDRRMTQDSYGQERRTGSGRAAQPSGQRSSVHEKQALRDPGMEAVIRQREMERAERARIARERLERERREDERRARAAATRESAAALNRLDDDEDDFEFLDL